MCWVALQSGIRLAREGRINADVDELQRVAEAIKHEVQERGFNEEAAAYTAAYEAVDLDASILTLPIVGFEDARSSRMRQTTETLRRALGRDELVFRHQNSETGGEGAFLLCSFWLVECLVLQGRLAEAKDLFERLLHLMNDAGLYAEEADPHDRSFLGNFPQAFTHVGLINAALTISAAEKEDAEST
jgi:GH15 family glucan-1,4-alpha-glucosidase